MKELLENYGLAADSNDVDSIKKQMERILFDPIFTAELKEKSLERSFDFSWRKTAIETLGVYEEIIVENHVVYGNGFYKRTFSTYLPTSFHVGLSFSAA